MDLGDSAKLVISHAERARVEFDQRYLGVEHLFLGVVALDDPRLRRRFDDGRADLREAVQRVREAASGEVYPDGDYLGLTVRAKRTMAKAERLAAAVRPERSSNDAVRAPHILLAILAEDRGLPARTLTSLGADLAALDRSIRDLIAREWTESASLAQTAAEQPQAASASLAPADDRRHDWRAAAGAAVEGRQAHQRLMSGASEAQFEIVAGPNDGFTFAYTDDGVVFEGEVLGPPPGSGLGPKDLDDVEIEIGDDGVALTCEVTFWLHGAEVTGTHLLSDGDVVRVGMTEMMLVWHSGSSAHTQNGSC
jgi:hypothetical protein